MNKVTLCTLLALGVAFTASARPESRHHKPAHRRPAVHRPAPKPHRHHHKESDVRWGLNISPWGSSFTIGSHVGKHGGVSLTVPLSTPKPVVYKEKTVIVQQTTPVVVQPAPVIVQTPPVVNQGVELNPLYANNQVASTRTWVEGYWQVSRTPDGYESSRVWVPGHWE